MWDLLTPSSKVSEEGSDHPSSGTASENMTTTMPIRSLMIPYLARPGAGAAGEAEEEEDAEPEGTNVAHPEGSVMLTG
jgi:hypothetical protein